MNLEFRSSRGMESFMLKRSASMLVFTALLLQGAAAIAQPAADVTVERNVVMKTRDGVALKADVYRPANRKSVV